ncbi:unnamed protein product [Closterium sp. NIES-65]|nr:unnamed protein product [Closterium sp. NIES-65]
MAVAALLIGVVGPADAHARFFKDASRLDSNRRELRRLSELERLQMARGRSLEQHWSLARTADNIAAAVATAAAAASSSPSELSHQGRILAEAAAGGTAVLRLSSPYVYGRFYATLTLGTPAHEAYVVLDTVSSLSWLYCDCIKCPSSPLPTDPTKPRTFFNSSASSTASALACNSSACAAFPMAACGALETYSEAGVCEYYTPDSAGDVLTDALRVTSADRVVSAPTVAFGCARVDAQGGSGIFAEVDGALGLGTQPYSLLGQLSASANGTASAAAAGATAAAAAAVAAGGGADAAVAPAGPAAAVAAVWSLCYDSMANSGVLVLGSMTPPANMVTTRFDTAADDSSYYLPVWRMRVGSIEVPGSKSLSRRTVGAGGAGGGGATRGGVVVDSDITYTALRGDVFLRVVKLVFADPRLVRQDAGGEVCVFVKASDTNVVLFPPIFFDFKEGSYEVTFNNYLMMNDASEAGATLCLTAYALPNDRVHDAHIGTLWLRDQFIQFNLPNKTMSFVPLNCTSGKPVEAAPQPSPTPSKPSTPATTNTSAPKPTPTPKPAPAQAPARAPTTPSAKHPTPAPPSSRAPAPASSSPPSSAPSSAPSPARTPLSDPKKNSSAHASKPAPSAHAHLAPASAASPSPAASSKGTGKSKSPAAEAPSEAPSGAPYKGDGERGVAGGVGGEEEGHEVRGLDGVSSGGEKVAPGNASALSPPLPVSQKKSASFSTRPLSLGPLALSALLSVTAMLFPAQPLHHRHRP